MTSINVGFTFKNQDATIFAQGNLQLDDQTGIVSGIDGTVGGNPIKGLSTYRDPDNTLFKEPYFGRGLVTANHWSATAKGLSFTDGVTQYNLSGSMPFVGRPGQLGDTLYVSDGTTRTVDFYSDLISVTQPVCFGGGTRIRTARGEVAVEELRTGDLVVTASGALRPITWIGHRRLTAGARPLPGHQQPIHVRAGAFGAGLPAHELRLSPGHPVLVGADAGSEGGVLVPIMCLINGTSIAREPVASVTYWHVELDAHDILLAEGLPAESYLDWGDRPFFEDASDHALHNPDFVVPGLAARCRPVAVDGPVVETERTRLAALFEAELTAHCAWDTNGLGARML
ncbi:Hint domain-containing protein [Methylobacterium sp. EM32]|uniref:Hint domain-containing protein n=1 Tax=Methylobacterium sp. EM32 TaxID=3163481 RepID=UPI0033B65359